MAVLEAIHIRRRHHNHIDRLADAVQVLVDPPRQAPPMRSFLDDEQTNVAMAIDLASSEGLAFPRQFM